MSGLGALVPNPASRGALGARAQEALTAATSELRPPTHEEALVWKQRRPQEHHRLPHAMAAREAESCQSCPC